MSSEDKEVGTNAAGMDGAPSAGNETVTAGEDASSARNETVTTAREDAPSARDGRSVHLDKFLQDLD